MLWSVECEPPLALGFGETRTGLLVDESLVEWRVCETDT